MTQNSKAPIVAELGRPETPQETAERKAEASRNHRARQTVNNLVYALIATLAIVAVIVLIVPRSTPTEQNNIDYAAVASEGQGTEPDRLAVPNLPRSWTSNSAELKSGGADKIDAWYIGLITPSEQYIGFTQGFKANDTWLANLLENSVGTGAVTIDGIKWTVYDNRHSSRDVGNAEYALSTQAGSSTFVLLGTAKVSEFDVVARALAPQISAIESKGNK